MLPNHVKAVKALDSAVPGAVSSAFKQLLQTKHLYQHVVVALPKETEELIAPYSQVQSKAVVLLWGPWSPMSPGAPVARPNPSVVYFLLPTVETFCEWCRKAQPFNPVGVDAAPLFATMFSVYKGGVSKLSERFSPESIPVQVFVLSYECQGCKRVPEVFLVRREGVKLVLSGRSPIEHVEVPKFIPRKEADWYSGAIVAYQSGQELAALFLLRNVYRTIRAAADALNHSSR